MPAVASRSRETPTPVDATKVKLDALPRARGVAEVAFRRRGDATVLADLFQAGSARVRFPGVERGAASEAVLINTAGGMTDGDHMEYGLRLDPGAEAVVTTQAAEKIYRSRGPESRVETALQVADGAFLAWIPQETILFERARLRRDTRIEIAPEARVLACESLVFGRLAHGERLRAASVHDAWRVTRGGELLWADAFRLDGDMEAALARPAVMDGGRALATVVYAGPDAEGRLDTLRRGFGDIVGRGAASHVGGGLLVARLIAEDAMTLRRDLGAVLTQFRSALAGRAVAMPAVWGC